MSQTLPKYIKVLDVARWLSEDTKEIWTVERVTRILRQMGLITKVGRINYVRPEELAGAWPEWFELIIERLSQCKTTSNPLVGLSREKGTMKWIRTVNKRLHSDPPTNEDES